MGQIAIRGRSNQDEYSTRGVRNGRCAWEYDIDPATPARNQSTEYAPVKAVPRRASSNCGIGAFYSVGKRLVGMVSDDVAALILESLGPSGVAVCNTVPFSQEE